MGRKLHYREPQKGLVPVCGLHVQSPRLTNKKSLVTCWRCIDHIRDRINWIKKEPELAQHYWAKDFLRES
jgi:hypothetical protein